MNEKQEQKEPEFTRESGGYKIEGWYEGGGKDGTDGLIRLTKPDGTVVDRPCPSYKIWNYYAHFHDIIDGDLRNNDAGYRIAGSTGLEPGTVVIIPKGGD